MARIPDSNCFYFQIPCLLFDFDCPGIVGHRSRSRTAGSGRSAFLIPILPRLAWFNIRRRGQVPDNIERHVFAETRFPAYRLKNAAPSLLRDVWLLETGAVYLCARWRWIALAFGRPNTWGSLGPACYRPQVASMPNSASARPSHPPLTGTVGLALNALSVRCSVGSAPLSHGDYVRTPPVICSTVTPESWAHARTVWRCLP